MRCSIQYKPAAVYVSNLVRKQVLAHSCHAPLVLRAVDETIGLVREGHKLRAAAATGQAEEEMALQISDDADAQLAAQQPLQATRRSS